jgi:high-affinity Fe2+/Pb2+ permease
MSGLGRRVLGTAAACAIAWLAYEAVARAGFGAFLGDLKPLIGLGAVFLALTIADALHRQLRRRPSNQGS